MEEFVLKRSEAYIGVLIDDLVNKSTDEPYRMFTSRAEHRLLLRQDNADIRLAGYGFKYGLNSKEYYDEVEERKNLINNSVENFNNIKIHASSINSYLESKGQNGINSTETVSKLCKRPELNLRELLNYIENNGYIFIKDLKSDDVALEQVEIQLKYEGYMKRQQEMVEKLEKYESAQIPLTMNYTNIKALSAEGREKLNKVKPRSIGQASRISGVTPSDISILLVYLKN